MQIQTSSVSFVDTSAATKAARSDVGAHGARTNPQQHITSGVALGAGQVGATTAPVLRTPSSTSSSLSASKLGEHMDARMADFSAGESAITKMSHTPMQQWGGTGIDVMSRVMEIFAKESRQARSVEIHTQRTMLSLTGFKQESLRKQAIEGMSAAAGGAAVGTALSVGGTAKTVKSFKSESKSITNFKVASTQAGGANAERGGGTLSASATNAQGRPVQSSLDLSGQTDTAGAHTNLMNQTHESNLNKASQARQKGQMISDLSRPASTLADASRSTMSLNEQAIQVGLDGTLEIEKTAVSDAQDQRQKHQKVVDDARQAMRNVSSSNAGVAGQIAAQIKV